MLLDVAINLEISNLVVSKLENYAAMFSNSNSITFIKLLSERNMKVSMVNSTEQIKKDLMDKTLFYLNINDALQMSQIVKQSSFFIKIIILLNP